MLSPPSPETLPQTTASPPRRALGHPTAVSLPTSRSGAWSPQTHRHCPFVWHLNNLRFPAGPSACRSYYRYCFTLSSSQASCVLSEPPSQWIADNKIIKGHLSDRNWAGHGVKMQAGAWKGESRSVPPAFCQAGKLWAGQGHQALHILEAISLIS